MSEPRSNCPSLFVAAAAEKKAMQELGLVGSSSQRIAPRSSQRKKGRPAPASRRQKRKSRQSKSSKNTNRSLALMKKKGSSSSEWEMSWGMTTPQMGFQTLKMELRDCTLHLAAAIVDPFSIHNACLPGSAPINSSFGTTTGSITFTTSTTKCTVLLLSPQWIFSNIQQISLADPNGDAPPNTPTTVAMLGALFCVYAPPGTGTDAHLSMNSLSNTGSGASFIARAGQSQFTYDDWDETISFDYYNNILPATSQDTNFPFHYTDDIETGVGINEGKLASYRVVSGGFRIVNDTPIMSGSSSQIDNFLAIQSADHQNILESTVTFDDLVNYPGVSRYRGVPVNRRSQINWYPAMRNEYEVAVVEDGIQNINVEGSVPVNYQELIVNSAEVFQQDQNPFLIYSDLSSGAPEGLGGDPAEISAQCTPKFYGGQMAFVFAPSPTAQTYIVDACVNYEYVIVPKYGGGFSPGASIKPAGQSKSSKAVTAVLKSGGTSFSDKVSKFSESATSVIKGVSSVTAAAVPLITQIAELLA